MAGKLAQRGKFALLLADITQLVFWSGYTVKLSRIKPFRILAIDPSTRGFGFAILERRPSLIDWGVKGVRRDKNDRTVAKVKELISLYQPSVIVLEDSNAAGSRRCERVRVLLQMIQKTAAGERIRVQCFPPFKTKAMFARLGAASKDGIARAIVKIFPELMPQLPRVRRAWMAEDYRMSIFDAVALGMTLLFR